MTPNLPIAGSIIAVRNCGSLAMVFVGTEDGRTVPIPLDQGCFRRLLEGEHCQASDLVGRKVTWDGEQVRFLAPKAGGLPMPDPKFPLSRTAATPGAMQALAESGQSPDFFLSRHQAGDWGEVGTEDGRLNDEALIQGGRVLSAYRTLRGVRLWVITEADRSVTTILLPDEY
jgi:hypothetical protein